MRSSWLWYLRDNEGLLEAGLEELHTAKDCFVLRHPKTRARLGLLALHVDDACFSGEGPLWEKALTHVRQPFTVGKDE